MSQLPYLEVWVEGLGLVGPGLADWEQARTVLTEQAPYQPGPTALPAPELLPPAERRPQAGRDPATLANVFAASGGDGYNCHQICEAVATEDRQISPTRFHNSVHNAASGYWSIATGATPAAQVLGAYDSSFSAGLLEAMVQVAACGEPVLLVVGDCEYPEPLHAKRPIQDTGALALVLSPVRTSASLAVLRLPRRGSLAGGAPTALPAHWPQPLRQLTQSMPPMRGLVLFWSIALIQSAQSAPEKIAIQAWDPQVLQLEVQPV